MKALITVDALIKQTESPFMERVMKVRVLSRFKLPSQLGVYEGKTNPMDHLDSYKNLMMLQGVRKKNVSHLFTVHQKDGESLKDNVRCFNQVVLKVEDSNKKVVVMAVMEGLCPGLLFDFLSKSIPATLSALQNKADKYIAAKDSHLTHGSHLAHGSHFFHSFHFLHGSHLAHGSHLTHHSEDEVNLANLHLAIHCKDEMTLRLYLHYVPTFMVHPPYGRRGHYPEVTKVITPKSNYRGQIPSLKNNSNC
ncbi:hypothetical protein Acr_00g0024600 [Actinidia rufa]|uniref:Uncharacterized protein n=1 Tax=Actinidia rufa TaxID=165716 RepID=A0A7J0DDF9_9ERIC|nr:hypothetical protein Acr_00g0024600 [Actinidia rufa]